METLKFPESRTPRPIAALDAHERSVLSEGAPVRELEPGETLFRAGELGDSMYRIDEGEIELVFPKGREDKTLV